MVGIFGIGGIPEPANPRRVEGFNQNAGTARSVTRDEVLISAEAQDAAAINRLVQEANKKAEEIRAERVAQVKKSLEQGTYKVQEVVLQVAARVSRYIELQTA